MSKVSVETYENYLHRLKGKVFKILCLYEEQSETLDKYFNSLVHIELAGLRDFIQDLPHSIWYLASLSKLNTLYSKYTDKTITHSLMRSEVLGINNLIDKQIETLKEG